MSAPNTSSRDPSSPFEWLQVSDDMNLPRFMLESKHPLRPQQGTPCVIEARTGRTISIDELRSRSNALAAALHSSYGIGEGDVVMICSPNHIDYPVVIWAVHKLGGIATLSNPSYTIHELASQVSLTKPTLLIYHSSVLKAISSDIAQLGVPRSRIISLDRAHHWDCSIEDLVGRAEHLKTPVDHFPRLGGSRVALLVLSSGTSGAPKAVKLSHQSAIVNILQMAAHVTSGGRGFSPGDVLLQSLPFFHVAGLFIGLHLCLFLGMSVVIAEQYDFIGMLENIARYSITTLEIVPPQAITLCKHPSTRDYNLGSLKRLFIGAAPASAHLYHLLHDTFPNLQFGQLYGLTEVCCTATMSKVNFTPGSAGVLLAGIEARVVREDGSLADVGEKGELYLKTPAAAVGYLGNDEATSEAFQGEWVRTGDEVLFNERGEIFVLDRIKDLIKVRGFQVAPAELEGHLLKHPDVLETAVIGIPHDYNGQVPYAFIVLREPARQRIEGDSRQVHESELRASIFKHITDRAASFKKLYGIEFVISVPKTASGKILRRTLKKSWEDANRLAPKL